MKYKGTFKTTNGIYTDEVEARFRFIARIYLKLRNSFKLLKIETT